MSKLAVWLRELHPAAQVAVVVGLAALALAADAQRPVQYVAGILRNWERDGYPPGVQPVEPLAPVDEPVVELWRKCLFELQLHLASSTYVRYLQGSQAVALSDGVLVVEVYDSYGRDWLQARLSGMVTRTLSNISGEKLNVQWTVRAR